MRDVILAMSVSLDGFVSALNNENNWVFSTSSPDGRAAKVATISGAGIHVMGARSYVDMGSFYPSAKIVFAPAMNEIPKLVFSRNGLPALPAAGPDANATAVESWQTARVASGSLVDEIEKLKREPGKPIVVHGGATLAQSLVREDLVDEYRLAVHPVALGQGKPLFSTLESRRMLALVDCTRYEGGTLGLVYRRR